MNSSVQQAKQIIADNIYMTIATAAVDGTPWISPVFFAYDEQYNLYWVSNKDARHSSLIRANPRVALAVFNSQAPEGEGDAVYVEARAEELIGKNDIVRAMSVLDKRVTKDEFRVKSISEVTSTGAWRIYKAVPNMVTKLTRGELVNGQYIDTRVEIRLL